MEEAKTMKTPMSSSIKLDMDEKGKSVNSTMYRGMIVERKNTSGTCHFLGHSLVSWHSKKQNSLGFSLISVHLGLRVGVCSLLFDFILLWTSLSLSCSLDGSKVRDGTSRAFYSRVTYGLGGPVLSIRGVEIRLSLESICRILNIPSVGLRVYEAKAWPTMPRGWANHRHTA
ncbi:hypothetical protein AAG906_007430 [Vitis piasezkii]